MATYKIKTKRYLRKYTAAEKLPVSSTIVDAQRVVDELCNLPWLAVSPAEAGVTSHDETELDANVLNRDRFDAALFCAEHENGEHRAYANAACYKVSFPAGTADMRLTSLKVRVTSDAYNAHGARIALVTNSTGVIPTDCATCRGEGADGVHADGVAPQTIQTVGGKRYGYPTITDCVFSADPAEGEVALPSGGLVLGDCLYVFVLMENYNSVRGNWLEGSSCIRNLVEITTDAEISGWTDGGIVDLTADPGGTELAVLRNGILPYVPVGSPSGAVHVSVRADANLVIGPDGSQVESRTATGQAAAAALGRLYANFFKGDVDVETAGAAFAAPGASFNFTRTTEDHVSLDSDRPGPTDVMRLDALALVVPFVYPVDFAPTSVRFDFAALSLPDGARFNVFLASDHLLALTEDVLKSPGLYDGKSAPFAFIGKITGGTSATFALPAGSGRVGSFVVTGFFPPERCSLTADGPQGTGPIPFLPEVTLIN